MIVGIDLGTTNSLVGVFRGGAPVLIPNALGDLLTPSAVSVDEHGNTLVGLAARERDASHPQHSAQAFKRWMGTDKRLALGSRSFRAEELSALVLKSLKADAEAFLGEPVTEAVITVPAYFNEAQRRATRSAGELAGFKVERLLNEPTAAGLAYGLQERPAHASFLVFDLGGGTFDVSVLECFEGVVEVRASAGDTRLGGEDFTRTVAELFAQACAELAGPAHAAELDAWWNERAWWRMAEQGKRTLAEQEVVPLSMVWRGRTLAADIHRTVFDAACAELLQRLRRPIERALGDAQIDPRALSEVVLVGGATRMPAIRQLATRLFQRLPLRTIDPDLAIAHGAAVQAGLKARDAALDEVVLTDVMPYTLGIATVDEIAGRRVADRFSPIIERNTPVPVSRVQHYGTVQDHQRQIRIDVRQGESPIASENLQLGALEIEVPPAPAGQVGVRVRFSYDANGLLEVDAQANNAEGVLGESRNLELRTHGAQMSNEELQAARDRLAALKHHPREEQENRWLIERAKRLYEDQLGEERRAIQAWLAAFEIVLDGQDPRLIRQARSTLREQLDSVDRGFRF
jgi:molecular chaperone HscC